MVLAADAASRTARWTTFYYDCGPVGPCLNPAQPAMVPGTPNPSWGAEAFLDTPVINGTAYPTLTVKPQAYRLRILNAAHDRFWNLQLYQADMLGPCRLPDLCYRHGSENGHGGPRHRASRTTGRRMAAQGGAPDPTMVGPNFIHDRNRRRLPPQAGRDPPSAGYLESRSATFNAGNVSDFELLLGPAERADVIVDFSAYAGKTLILYNDAPAAFPALDPRNDYYTGTPDQFDTGGPVRPWSASAPILGPSCRSRWREARRPRSTWAS